MKEVGAAGLGSGINKQVDLQNWVDQSRTPERPLSWRALALGMSVSLFCSFLIFNSLGVHPLLEIQSVLFPQKIMLQYM